MRKPTFVELLVWAAISSIMACAVINAVYNKNSYHYAPDGTTIVTVEIDGHQYLKSGQTLTHSASCKACLERERK